MTSATIAAPDRRIGSRPVIGWLPMLVLPAGVLVTAPGAWPPWAHMWLLAIAIYASWKWLSWYAAPASAGPWWRHALYLALWPGLDAPAFLGTGKSARAIAPARGEWGLAAMNLAVGIALLWVVAPQIPPGYELLLGWVGMAGIVFVLHFGGVHLLSCAYRSCGINARPLMDWPIAATSVSDFWGRRWNTAFRDFTHRFVFRPLLARIGPVWSIAIGFAASGLVHDLVISLPARDGYGWPTLYFLLQGAAIYFERSPLGKRLGLGRGWRGWLFAAVVIAGPAYFLFHPPFVQNVIVPFLEVIGAT